MLLSLENNKFSWMFLVKEKLPSILPVIVRNSDQIANHPSPFDRHAQTRFFNPSHLNLNQFASCLVPVPAWPSMGHGTSIHSIPL